jgi:hypothetical protein
VLFFLIGISVKVAKIRLLAFCPGGHVWQIGRNQNPKSTIQPYATFAPQVQPSLLGDLSGPVHRVDAGGKYVFNMYIMNESSV